MPLAADADPRYSVVAGDAWQGKTTYLLFDGNTQQGYRRLYVWVPGDKGYETPKPVAAGENGVFPPIALVQQREGQSSAITWQFSARKQEWRRGGDQTRFDYATGEKVVVEGGAVESGVNTAFDYQVNYVRELGGSEKVDLVIRGGLPVAAEWGKRPGAVAPWDGIPFGTSVKRSATAEGARLTFSPGLGGATVRALPSSARVTIKVLPYLGEPIEEKSLPATEAFASGFSVDVPFGWYNFESSFECEGIKANPQASPHGPDGNPLAVSR